MVDRDNSDYNKPFTDLFELLPEVYRSDANRALFKNVFNRYVTKPDLTRIVGYLGQGNINAITRRQIPEDDPHRQAYQLQPILFEKVGSVEHLASWKDILTEVVRLGVDEDRYDEWGAATRFAWAPPIDIDKLIHYRDYYWFDEDDPTSRPEYITIRSRCTTATSNYNFWVRLIDSYGATVNIKSIDSSTNEVVVTGDFTPLYEPGFVFFVKDSTNPTLKFNDTFHTVKTSVWDEDAGVTLITLEPVVGGVGSPAADTFQFTSEIADGVLSLEEEEAVLRIDRDCLCSGTIGWDVLLWDDNPDDPLWVNSIIGNLNDSSPNIYFDTISSFETEYGGATLNDICWEDSTDTLQQYDGSSWVIIWNNFSALYAQTDGTALWDYNEECNLVTVEDAGEQWALSNKWFHKSEVTNFTVAKRAAVPIIEYEWDLELNEWSITNHTWKYRDQDGGPFDETTAQPTLIELTPFSLYEISGSDILLDERYGDQTSVFVPGYTFSDIDTGTLFTVESSRYDADGSALPYRTKVTVTVPGDLTALSGSPLSALEPNTTSLGDSWRGYNVHWVYVGISETTPVNHQVENPFVPVTETPYLHPTGDYITAQNYYAQEFSLEVNGITSLVLSNTVLSDTTRSLQQRALAGFDDVRVYINNVRQFGNYDEITGDEVSLNGSPEYGVYPAVGTPIGDDGYVKGIRFHSSVTLVQYDEVRIEVGPAALSDLGWYTADVRMTEDDPQYLLDGNTTISLIKYHKTEQVKTELNQYPIFDIFDVEGNSTYEANSIFGYLESPDVGINAATQRRIVNDGNGDFTFQQFLLKEDNGTLYAYRQYNSRVNSFWYNPERALVQFWDGLTWNPQYTSVANELVTVPVTAEEPEVKTLDMYWYDTLEDELKQWNSASWDIVPGVTKDIADETLQTVWRAGLNLEEFVPQYVDEERRPDGSVWYDRDGVENLVDIPVGDPDGDWQIPDQLYYNHLHENRVELTLRELFTHFSDIINNQEHVPGFIGPASSQFHLIPFDEVNYGVGGTILEFNDGFDTFLSSAFVNNVTPLGIVEFAHDQYESAIVELRELFNRNSVELLTDTTQDTFVNQGEAIADQIITLYEENDYNSLIYGDSTTFNDATDLGVRNWIATLPYIGLVWKHVPELLDDSDAGILEVVHHDGHRKSYTLTTASQTGIIISLLNEGDSRTASGGNPPDDTFGRQSSTVPPNNETEFASYFNSTILNRNGVYWYYTPTGTLYRLNLAAAGSSEPASDYPDDTLWFDTTTDPGVLKAKVGALWVAVPGVPLGGLHNGSTVLDATISAWQPVDLNTLLSQIVYGVEQRLYENAPSPTSLSYDFDTITDTPEKLAIYNSKLESAFADYVNQSDITAPLSASGHYVATDPFTWNYKRSVVGTAGSPLHPDYPGYESGANDGTETGGDWKDLYEKVYGTPYPHMEPWFIQGYTDKPDWWDEEYLNDDPLSKWGDRRWKYTHGFDIVAVDEFAEVISVSGDFTSVFPEGQTLTVQDSTANDGYYIVVGSPGSTYNIISDTTDILVSSLSGSPHVSAGADGKIVAYGATNLGYGMWENIRQGIVPTGRPLPTGRISTGVADEVPAYSYFSVNITNEEISADSGTTTYGPDDVLPPYWDQSGWSSPGAGSLDAAVQSLYSDFVTQVISPSADYAFGDAGPVEWEWRASSQYLYDQLSIAYQIDPARYVFLTFGVDLINISNLQVDRFYQNVYAHNRTNFHGEIVNNALLQVDGTNQWYVNYNRFLGFDSSYSDFRSLWTEWTAPLTYQFGAFIDSSSLQVGHNALDVTNSDYDVLMKRSPGVEDFWTDAFNVIITSMPPRIIRYENEGDWGLEIQSFSPLGRRINYYDVHKYEYNVIEPISGMCRLYTYPITTVSADSDSFSIGGDHTTILPAGRTITVTDSTDNDGTYTVVSAVYDSVDDVTIVDVDSAVIGIGSPLPDNGLLTINYRSLPWVTGDKVTVSTSELSPAPLAQKEQYFVIKISDTDFQLADTKSEALLGTSISYSSNGTGTLYIGEVTATFKANDGARTTEDWQLYSIDKTNVLEFTPPYDIKGMQHLIDIVHGYSIYAEDLGFVYNEDRTLVDPASGRRVSWLVELERYIDWAYTVRADRLTVNDRYNVTVDPLTEMFTFTEQQSNMITGERVNIMSSNGVYPAPIRRGVSYYMIRVSAEEFRLAATKLDATNGNAIDITSDYQTGNLSVTSAKTITQSFPRQEINAFRQMVWFKPERGIVSDTIKGPSEDLRLSQLLFDQYGRQIEAGNLKVYREDKITKLAMREGVANDIQLTSVFQDPYNFIHFGGAHLFIDTYEHVLQFNDYTTEGCLQYDPFLGLNTEKYELGFFRQTEKTGRPNVGGHFLSTYFNQGAELLRNMEALTNDMRLYYDTNVVPETIEAIRYSRDLFDYEGEVGYLKDLNLGPKSQFLFWKGMIQRKGSIGAIQAFINSRRFIDAKVDEFWAVKVSDFGSTGPQIYPEMYVNINDAISNELPIWMDDGNEYTYSELTDFTRVLMSDLERWYEQPNQFAAVKDTANMLYLDGKVADMISITVGTQPPTSPSSNDGWLDTAGSPNTMSFYRWNANTSAWDFHGGWDAASTVMIMRHGMNVDKVRITMNLYADGTVYSVPSGIISGSPLTITLPPGQEFIRYGGGIDLYDGDRLLDPATDYTVPVNLSDSLLANTIVLSETVGSPLDLTIVYKTSTLVDSPIDAASSPNSNTVLVGGEGYTELLRTVFPASMTLWGIAEDASVLNPMKVIDKDAGVVVSQVPIWNPSRGIHYYQGIGIVDLQNNEDPASYDEDTSWNSNEVGTVWMDTKELDYLPYRDESAFPTFAERSQYWGQLADWGELRLYEWTESDVLPEDYNELATTEETDSTIPEDERASGVARATLYTYEKSEENVFAAPATHLLEYAVKDGDVANIWIVEGTNGTTHVGTGSPEEFTLGTDGQTITFNWSVGGWDGIGTYTIFYISDTKTKVGDVHQEWDVPIEGVSNGSPASSYNFNGLVDYDIIPAYLDDCFVDVYVNGLLVREEQLTTESDVDLSPSGWNIVVNEYDTVRIRRSAGMMDIFIQTGIWEYDYEYTQVDTIDEVGDTVPTYYFWVGQKKTRTNNRTISLIDAENDMISNPEAFAFYQRLELSSTDRAQSVLDQLTNSDGVLYNPQDHYIEVIIRGLHGLIQDDRRYVLRFLKDYSLRDNLNEGSSALQLKNLHTEWKIFRQEQLFNVDRSLWDKITESMVGYKLSNTNVRVPSLDRELYDTEYGTDTMYGIGEGQAFTDGPTAIATITAYLQDGTNDFAPVDIDVFFDTYSFDTNANIVAAMNEIYNTFSYTNVNRMYFSVLQDSFGFKSKYEDMFKTSMISLHGIKPFQVAGVFDD